MTFSAQLSQVLRRERPETVSLAEAVSLATLLQPRLI